MKIEGLQRIELNDTDAERAHELFKLEHKTAVALGSIHDDLSEQGSPDAKQVGGDLNVTPVDYLVLDNGYTHIVSNPRMATLVSKRATQMLRFALGGTEPIDMTIGEVDIRYWSYFTNGHELFVKETQHNIPLPDTMGYNVSIGASMPADLKEFHRQQFKAGRERSSEERRQQAAETLAKIPALPPIDTSVVPVSVLDYPKEGWGPIIRDETVALAEIHAQTARAEQAARDAEAALISPQRAHLRRN